MKRQVFAGKETAGGRKAAGGFFLCVPCGTDAVFYRRISKKVEEKFMEERKIRFLARAKEQETAEYLEMAEHGLKGEAQVCKGTGVPKDPFLYKVIIANESGKPWEGVIHIGIERKRENPRIFMPGFMYGTNRGDTPMEGQRLYPRIRREQRLPASPWWMVRGDRLSHPAVLVWDTGRIYGFHASPYWTITDGKKQDVIGREETFFQYAGFTCNAYLQDERGNISQVGYTLGYENAPWLFVDSADVRERRGLEGQCFLLEEDEAIEFFLYVYDFEAEEVLEIHRVLEEVYGFYHEAPRCGASLEETVRDLAEAVKENAWLPERKAYSLFVFNAPESDEVSFRELGSFSWTNGLSVAVPMLMAAVRLSDSDMKEQAMCCISNIVENCMNERSGLPYDGYMDGEWTQRGWWFDGIKTPGHTGYLAGQGVYYLMKAYQFLKDTRKEEHPEWLAFAKPIVEKLEIQKNYDKEYPYILSVDTGAGLEYDSFGSVWCMTAVLAYMEASGERVWLDGVRESEEHYYQAFVKKCECYGGPLDISKGIDSEGILAYIRAVVFLHKMTGEEKYLRHLRDGIDYELTFKFCYHSPIKVPPLSKTGWCSCGGSITSVVNPHIHPMSSTIVDELLYYVKQTKDDYIKSRLRDVLLWGSQTYNHYDREFDYGKKGWMSERFCYSQGLLKETYPDNSLSSTWFALMPWAGASIMEGMAGEVWEFSCDNVVK